MLTRLIASGAAIGLLTAAAASADPSDASSKLIPLSPLLKRCDFSEIYGLPPATVGSGYTLVSSNGSTVTDEVHLVRVQPDTWYGVRLVEEPRQGDHCGGSDPGVAMGRLYTDGNGDGVATVTAPVMRGATGAWVSVEGPVGNAQQLSGDYRTSDFIAVI